MTKLWVGLWLVGLSVTTTLAAKAPVDYANPLVGTASLDNPKLRGNAQRAVPTLALTDGCQV